MVSPVGVTWDAEFPAYTYHPVRDLIASASHFAVDEGDYTFAVDGHHVGNAGRIERRGLRN